jgi:hypothetical protein
MEETFRIRTKGGLSEHKGQHEIATGPMSAKFHDQWAYFQLISRLFTDRN